MNENDLEIACLDWLERLGYTCLAGESVSPGGESEARGRYSEVVLAPRLRDAVVRLNEGLTGDEVEETVTKLALYGAQSLVDGNREVYDWGADRTRGERGPSERYPRSGH